MQPALQPIPTSRQDSQKAATRLLPRYRRHGHRTRPARLGDARKHHRQVQSELRPELQRGGVVIQHLLGLFRTRGIGSQPGVERVPSVSHPLGHAEQGIECDLSRRPRRRAIVSGRATYTGRRGFQTPIADRGARLRTADRGRDGSPFSPA